MRTKPKKEAAISRGHKAQEIPGEDEDREGRSNSEREVEKGVKQADRDQRLQATEAEQQEDSS